MDIWGFCIESNMRTKYYHRYKKVHVVFDVNKKHFRLAWSLSTNRSSDVNEDEEYEEEKRINRHDRYNYFLMTKSDIYEFLLANGLMEPLSMRGDVGVYHEWYAGFSQSVHEKSSHFKHRWVTNSPDWDILTRVFAIFLCRLYFRKQGRQQAGDLDRTIPGWDVSDQKTMEKTLREKVANDPVLGTYNCVNSRGRVSLKKRKDNGKPEHRDLRREKERGMLDQLYEFYSSTDNLDHIDHFKVDALCTICRERVRVVNTEGIPFSYDIPATVFDTTRLGNRSSDDENEYTDCMTIRRHPRLLDVPAALVDPDQTDSDETPSESP